MDGDARPYRAGQAIDDLCRSCHTTRTHTIVALEADGSVARVMCDVCRSEHNYRGGGGAVPGRASAGGSPRLTPRASAIPLVTERERTGPGMTATGDGPDLELLLRRVLREELGLTPAAPAEKWRGGELVLKPGRPGLQEKRWPIESFFHKIVMIRNRLRTLEQQVNASDLPEDAKLRLQGYVTACYGSLTSFNVLFADENDQFAGAGGD